jgi:Domain of unknown function (DUF4440)
MKIACCGFLLLAWLAANAQSGRQQEAQPGRILALESAWDQALLQKDAKAMEPLLDEELIYIDYDGTVMNKVQYLARVRSEDLRFEHIVSESMQVRMFRQSAVVIGIYREQGTRNGKPYIHRERFVDTWIDHNGAWMCVTSQSTLIPR